jgi:hypothetical protein
MTSGRHVTEELVRKAILGAAIVNSRELFASYGGRVPQECIDAARVIQSNHEEFRHLVWKSLESLPFTKRVFGRLIRARLGQRGILASPIITVIFDDYQTLEQRLSNIQSVPGVESWRAEYRGSNAFSQGDTTDALIRNLLAEVLALDFLLKLQFTNVQKLSFKGKAHIDILAERDGGSFAIDATRKQEVAQWESEVSTGLEDCNSDRNQMEIRRLLVRTLNDKDEQFHRALVAETVSASAVKVVAVKTSDYGFSHCIEEAGFIAHDLLSAREMWPIIDCIWLLPNVDVAQSKWVCRSADYPPNDSSGLPSLACQE